MNDQFDVQPQDGYEASQPSGPGGAQEPGQQLQRGEPQAPESRRKLVAKLCKMVKEDKRHWRKAFKQMREDQDFCFGTQWSGDAKDDRYVANITQRHVQQRVAALYAKNPKAVTRRRDRLNAQVWDGTLSQVMMAMQQVQNAAANPQGAQQAMAIIQEATQVEEQKTQLELFARTLELAYEYNIDEQAHNFKTMMKLAVRRAVTVGVGYIKLGFQRVLEPRPDLEARIADATTRMSHLKRLSADMADEKFQQDHAPELEELRLSLQLMQQEQEIVVREGLVFDYPDSTSIIPDRKTRQLREFLGADYVTQEYQLTPDEIKEIYGVDITDQFTKYKDGDAQDDQDEDVLGQSRSSYPDDAEHNETDTALVWEMYHRKSGLVYVLCDGYSDFLREPAAPEVWTERFWPWFALVLNECDHPREIFPPSDVKLIRHQQRELNRLREGIREHRIANRPKTAVAAGTLSEGDVEKLQTHPPNAVLELDGLQPGQSVEQLLMPVRLPGVDPNLYEVNGVFDDVLRTVGVQEANLGAVSGGTATESSIAESSRVSSTQSNIDDLDDLLTEMARTSGQIMMAEFSADMVKEMVGPGAVWPEMRREDLAKELWLEIEAGSTGRPNQAQEIQNFERLAPLLIQLPGVSPEFMVREAIRRLDDRLDMTEAYDKNLLSIQALNQVQGAPPGGPQQTSGQDAPADQGAQGANNGPTPDGLAGAPAGPEIPAPSVPIQ